MLNVPQITHNELMSILTMTYEKNLPMFVHGTYGIGKTQTVENFAEQYAKKVGLKYSSSIKDINKEDYFMCLIIPMTLYDNVNLGGIPVKEGDKTVFLPTSLLPRKGQGILFFDELNLAPPLTQSTVYGIIQKGVVGELVLPKGYMRIGAGNIDSDMAYIFSMANPLKNRFGHVELKVPEVERWIKDFAIQHSIDNRIIIFLSANEHRLFSYNPDSTSEDMAIATPRTWEMASGMIIDIENENPMLETFVSMFVGNAIGIEFMAHIKMTLSFKISEVFEGKKFKVPTEIDQIYAFMGGIISYYLKKINDKELKEEDKLSLCKKFYELVNMLSKEHMITSFYLVSKQDQELFPKLKKALSKTEYKKFEDFAISFCS